MSRIELKIKTKMAGERFLGDWAWRWNCKQQMSGTKAFKHFIFAIQWVALIFKHSEDEI